MKIQIDNRLHSLMREVTRRKRRERGMSLAAFYCEAIEQFVKQEKIPRRVFKIERIQVALDMPEGFDELFNSISTIAVTRQQSLSVIMEEALQRYLDLPQNYLGKNFYKKHKREYHSVGGGEYK